MFRQDKMPKSHVAPPAHLETYRGVHGKKLEAKVFVEIHAGGIGQGDAGVGVEIAQYPQALQQRGIESPGNAASSVPAIYVDGNFH